MANKYAGVYFGFPVWEKLLRARLYAVQTAPTINVSINDMVQLEKAGLFTAKLGLVAYVSDSAVPSSTPGDEFLFAGGV